jgi:hypothetical protein
MSTDERTIVREEDRMSHFADIVRVGIVGKLTVKSLVLNAPHPVLNEPIAEHPKGMSYPLLLDKRRE